MFMYQVQKEYFAVVAGGLEELAAKELEKLGATDIRPFSRGIDFKAEQEDLYRIVYCTRLLSRVLAPLTRFDIKSSEDLYLKAKQIDWTHLLTLDQTFGIFANVSNSVIDNSHFAALKLKDVVADMFRKRYKGKRPNVDPRDPDLWINLHIRENVATISLDCAGGSLHRRGYRQRSVEAPMQETLAAAVLDLAGWEGKEPLYDPMCGSGTLLSEAFIKASRLPAGCLQKTFGFQMLPDHDRRVWVKVKLEVDNRVRNLAGNLIRGSDIDKAAVAMTRANNANLPGGDDLRVKTADFRDLPEIKRGLIVCNPPYGIRMKAGDDMETFIKEFGDFLKQKCAGCRAWIYFGDPVLIKSVGLKAKQRIPLRNGGLDGRLVSYDLF